MYIFSLRWVSLLWNHMISTTVSEAVIKGSETQTPTKPGGQQKVASTALYVLMQRAILPGCPLSGQGSISYYQGIKLIFFMLIVFISFIWGAIAYSRT